MEYVGASIVGRGSGVEVGFDMAVGTGVGIGVLGTGVAVEVGDGVGVSGTGVAVEVRVAIDVGAGVDVGDEGDGVSGRGVAVGVGARATAGTGVEVEGWLTVSEPPQATAKKSAAPISVRTMREVVTSKCPLSAWVV